MSVSGGTLLVQGNAALSQTVLLSGGDFVVEMSGGGSLAGMANEQSDFTGGRDTLATLLDGTTSTTNLNTTFTVTALASNDVVRQSDVYALGDVSPDGTYVLHLSAATVDASSVLGWLDPETNTWVNAAESTGAMSFTQIHGAYNASYDIAGYYGIDGDRVWAVLNLSSGNYAIITTAVPEPSTMVLGGIGRLVLGCNGVRTLRCRKMP